MCRRQLSFFFRCLANGRRTRNPESRWRSESMSLLQSWDSDQPALAIVSPDVAELGASQRRADGVRVLQLTDPWGNAIQVVDRVPSADG